MNLNDITTVIIGIDVDGVIRNFTNSFNIYYNKYAEKASKPLIDVNYEPEQFDMYKDKYDFALYKKVWNFSTKDMLMNAKPYEGALQFVDNLYMLFNSEVRFITNQKTKTAEYSTIIWLHENKFLPFGGVVIAKGDDKHKYCNILIDDKISNLVSAEKNDTIPVCVARNWNKTIQHGFRGNYEQILKYIKENL